MRPASVLVAGELMWDLHGASGAPLDEVEGFRRVVGGAAANVAMELTRDGVATAVGGVVSPDLFGLGLRAALDRRGIDVSALTEAPGRTGLVFIEHTATEHERYVSYPPRVDTFPKTLPLPVGWEGDLAGRALHLGALTPHPGELGAFARLARDVARRGGWISVDLNARPRSWRGRKPTAALRRILARADVVKASERDLDVLGLGERPFAEAREALAIAGVLAVTRGRRPTEVVGPFGGFGKRPPKVTPLHSIGAGDALCAGMLAALVAVSPHASRDRAAFWRRVVARGHVAAARRITEPPEALHDAGPRARR